MVSANDLAVTWTAWKLTAYAPPLDPRPLWRPHRRGFTVPSIRNESAQAVEAATLASNPRHHVSNLRTTFHRCLSDINQ
ncbi:hypothetical protein Y032_0783g2323 [Ancylostoma ceylanicum]|nr:hypothetical protein Y032_0783g2323 [Ancylostoma ceylanicum]